MHFNGFHNKVEITPLRRKEIAVIVIEWRLTMVYVACIYGVCAKIRARWIRSLGYEGCKGMFTCSSCRNRLHQLTDAKTVDPNLELSRLRQCGKRIARQAVVSPPTVKRVLRKTGLFRLARLVAS